MSHLHTDAINERADAMFFFGGSIFYRIFAFPSMGLQEAARQRSICMLSALRGLEGWGKIIMI